METYNSMLGMNGALMMPHLNGDNTSSAAAAAAKQQQVNGGVAARAAACSSVPQTSAHAAALSTGQQQQLQAQLQQQQLQAQLQQQQQLQEQLQQQQQLQAQLQQQQLQAQLQQQQSSSSCSAPNSSNPAADRIFVGGLSYQTSFEKLRQYFGLFGTVTNVSLMMDPITKRSRGYGFISFSDPETVDKVLKQPIHTLDGKKINPKHATARNQPKLTNVERKVFVGGVRQDTSFEDVEAYFQQFGKVKRTVMIMDQQTKSHRGYGFVTFESKDVADAICQIHFHKIKNWTVECKKAQPKVVQRQAVQSGLLLGKHVMMGVGPPLVAAQAQVQVAAAAVAAQEAAAAARNAAVSAQNAAVRYGELLSRCGYPGLASYRYAPYPMPLLTQATSAPAPAPQASPSAAPTPETIAAASQLSTDNQGYILTNVNMSSFQDVDWKSLYNMGM